MEDSSRSDHSVEDQQTDVIKDGIDKGHAVKETPSSSQIGDPGEGRTFTPRIPSGGSSQGSSSDAVFYPMPASAIQGGREVNRRVLYVGGLEKSITEAELKQELLDILREGGVEIEEETEGTKDEEKKDEEPEKENKEQDEPKDEEQTKETGEKKDEKVPEDIENAQTGDLTKDDAKEASQVSGREEANFASSTSPTPIVVPVKSIKILADKNRLGFNYAFVDFGSPRYAEIALNALEGKILRRFPLTANYGFQSQQAIKDTENFNIFVGDLSSEVDDQLLSKAFSVFGSMVEARVMWDMTTGRSRGYGFVSFKDRADAEEALKMNGQWIGSRMIRCNWATGTRRSSHPQILHQQPTIPALYPVLSSPTLDSMVLSGSSSSTGSSSRMGSLSPMPESDINGLYQRIVKQTPPWQTTVYVGNLQPFLSPTSLLPIVQNFGYVVDFKHQSERGYAFVKYDSHERAALAIVSLNGFNFNGNILKCNWGKERQAMGRSAGIVPLGPGGGAPGPGQFSPGIEYPAYYGFHRI